ncbi:uncharacterized [Tachysurus ichikawai]
MLAVIGPGRQRKPGTRLGAVASSGQLGSGDAPCRSGALWQSPLSPLLASSSSFKCQPDSQHTTVMQKTHT